MQALLPKRRGETDDDDSAYLRLSADRFAVVADWYHFAILELLRVEDVVHRPAWIARALGITASEVHAAIERLARIGFLEVAADGTLLDRSSGKSTTLGIEPTNAALKRKQTQALNKALAALEDTPEAVRDHSTMTMSFDSRRLPEAKRRIRAFRRSLAKYVSRETDRCDEVYHLSIALYPLTDTGRKRTTHASRL
jgi:uncharacterized protein (TIGR02147 family)